MLDYDTDGKLSFSIRLLSVEAGWRLKRRSCVPRAVAVGNDYRWNRGAPDCELRRREWFLQVAACRRSISMMDYRREMLDGVTEHIPRPAQCSTKAVDD